MDRQQNNKRRQDIQHSHILTMAATGKRRTVHQWSSASLTKIQQCSRHSKVGLASTRDREVGTTPLQAGRIGVKAMQKATTGRAGGTTKSCAVVVVVQVRHAWVGLPETASHLVPRASLISPEIPNEIRPRQGASAVVSLSQGSHRANSLHFYRRRANTSLLEPVVVERKKNRKKA